MDGIERWMHDNRLPDRERVVTVQVIDGRVRMSYHYQDAHSTHDCLAPPPAGLLLRLDFSR